MNCESCNRNFKDIESARFQPITCKHELCEKCIESIKDNTCPIIHCNAKFSEYELMDDIKDEENINPKEIKRGKILLSPIIGEIDTDILSSLFIYYTNDMPKYIKIFPIND